MPRSFRKRPAQLVLGIAFLVLAAWGASHWIGERFEKALLDGLAKRELGLTWETSSWSPWSGLELGGLRLHPLRHPQNPIAEWDHLNLSIRVDQLAAGKAWKTDWRIRDSAITLHDPSGPIHLRDASMELEAGGGLIRFTRLQARHRGLLVRLVGSISLDPTPSDPQAFEPDFRVVRGILAVLDVTEGTGPFEVKGNFHVISNKKAAPEWSAQLDGQGSALEWKGVTWSRATASASLGNRDSVIHYKLHTAHGSTRGDLRRADWKDSRFLFQGELRDSSDRLNTYQGSYGKRLLVLANMKGNADLRLLAKDIPALAGRIPESLEIQPFPAIEVKHLVRDATLEKPTLAIESATLRSDGEITVTYKNRSIPINDLSASASYKNSGFVIRDSSAKLFGGSFAGSGTYKNGTLSDAKLRIRDIRLSEIKSMPGNRPGVLSGDYRGNMDFSTRRAEGTGSMHMENAPVIEVPLLDQVYDLFMAMIPGVSRSGEGRFEAEFRARGDVVEVHRFEATGGTLTVSAVGEVDLEKSRVSGRARGKLTGLPGLVTSPLSRLLEMDVAGPYDDIRVKPLGPAKLASNTASGVVGTVVDTIEEAGKITGTILTEGVKLPFRFLDEAPKPEKPRRKPAGKK